jgi:antitoxin FitA
LEVAIMEQILIRNLPAGTKAVLTERAARHHRSMEAEARAIMEEALVGEPTSIVDYLAMPESYDIDFEPERLGLTARTVEL